MSLKLDHKRNLQARHSGFTLIELTVVIVVIGLLSTFAVWRLGNFDYWREESFIRKFSETIVFLHHQAIFDQMFYALEVDLTEPKKPRYKVGVFNPDPATSTTVQQDPQTTIPEVIGGNLSNNLADFLSPSVGANQTFTDSPTFPSLAEPVEFPTGMYIGDIRTMRGKIHAADGGKVYIMFSPRGFSDFAVFHIYSSKETPITILVNPFTGNTEIIREYKDYEWTYGKKGKKS